MLRVLADREGAPARFLVLGSASPLLLRQSSESLAGRIAYHELDGLSLEEVGTEQGNALWLRGGFPRSYLAESDPASSLWLESRDDLLGHPKVGASWEGFAIGEVVAHLGARPEECFFWKLHSGAELDLLIRNGSSRRGFEIKLTTSPRVTPSMSSAIENLDLEDLVVIHAGAESYRLTSRIRAVALARLREDVAPVR